MAIKDLYRRMHKTKPRDPRAIAEEIKRQRRLEFFKERWELSKSFVEQNLTQAVR
jgi:hypothetical protein